MLDGTLFIVKCARYGNPGKNACSDFFLSFKAFFLNAVVFCLKGGRLFKKDGHVFKKDGHLFPAPKIHTDLHSYLLEIKRNAANEEVEVQNDKNAHSIGRKRHFRHI